MGVKGDSFISTGFSGPGDSRSPSSAHPLLPPAPHALNSPRACLSLTARANTWLSGRPPFSACCASSQPWGGGALYRHSQGWERTRVQSLVGSWGGGTGSRRDQL